MEELYRAMEHAAVWAAFILPMLLIRRREIAKAELAAEKEMRPELGGTGRNEYYTQAHFSTRGGDCR